MAKATLLSIAQRTGISVTTVSRVLNGKAEKYRISPKTVELVKQEAERCNYQPNINAQSLRTNRTRTIGLVVPSISNLFFANIASCIVQKAKDDGYTVILTDAMECEANEKSCLQSLLSRNVDGIIVSTSATSPEFLEYINETKVPVVLFDRYFPHTTLPFITTDNQRGAFLATKHLIQNGHKHIACICGTQHLAIVQDRLCGYIEAMQQAKLNEYVTFSGDEFSIENGYYETKLLLSKDKIPTAIFAMNNTILLGVIKAVNDSGLRIPNDISIVSFDDNPYLDFFSPAITRVIQPQNVIGTLAMRTLIQCIQNRDLSEARFILPPSLKKGNSVLHL